MMAHIKRWTQGLVSRVDTLVVQVENHEAQVESAIRELGRVVAQARIQLRRVERDGICMRERQQNHGETATVWRERAAREPEDGRALECLRRARQAVRQAQRLSERIAEHERSEQQLTRDVTELEERLRELVEQKHQLATRQSRAEARSVVQRSETGLGGELEQIFERWDTRVTEAEYLTGRDLADHDELEELFATKEEELELKSELAELRRTK